MSKVIKNNDGVAVVEGTPAASLIKDSKKFFAAKTDTRMAGEAVKPQTMKSIVQSGKVDTRLSQQTEGAAAAAALTKPMMKMIDGRNTIVGYMLDGATTMFNEAQMNLSPLEKADLLPKRVMSAMQGGDSSGGKKALDPKEINTKTPTAADLEQMNNPPGKEPMAAAEAMALSLGLDKGSITGRTAPFVTSQGTFGGTNTVTKGQADAINRGLSSPPVTLRMQRAISPAVKPRTETPIDPDAILAMNLARDFKRKRSSKELERSQAEKDATGGKFITTLGR